MTPLVSNLLIRLLATLLVLGGPLLRTSARASASADDDRRVLRLARPTDPLTLDPARVGLAADFVLLYFFNVPLLDVVDGTRLIPAAAAEWSMSVDARVFTFHLRPELRFSNGRHVVAADYAYALERILDPQTGSWLEVYLKGIRGAAAFKDARKIEEAGIDRQAQGASPPSSQSHVAGIRTPDSRTLVIELDKPDITFPYLLTSPSIAAPLPREEIVRCGSDFGIHPVGSGPCMVAEWKRGVQLVLTPNPYYTGVEPRHFDRIEIMVGGDASTHLMMFERGELDLADITTWALPVADQRRILGSSRWRPCIESAFYGESTWVFLNTEMPPLDNLNVRRACNYAIDKERILHADDGHIQVAGGVLPPFIPGYDPNQKGYPYDPAKALALLAESGVPLPIRFTLWYDPGYYDYGSIAMGVQHDLGKVGIEVELRQVTFGEMYAAATHRGKVQAGVGGWLSGLPDPKDVLGSCFDGRTIVEGATANNSFYNNPEVNRLLDEAAATIDLPTRYAVYRRIEETIVQDAPFIFIGFHKAIALKQPSVKGRLIEPLCTFRLDRIWKEP